MGKVSNVIVKELQCMPAGLHHPQRPRAEKIQAHCHQSVLMAILLPLCGLSKM